MNGQAPSVWIGITGDELLHGDLVDANGPWLARELSALGWQVTRFVGVGDDLEDLADLIDSARREGADWLIVTGGLGGTADDLTRPAAAKAFGRELVESSEALAGVHRFWRALGRDPKDRRWPEASLPSGSQMIHNPRGLAPGFLIEEEGFSFAAFPGVPRELREMAPAFLAPYANPERALARAELLLFGVAESAAAEQIGGLLDRDRDPLIGIAAKEGFLRLTLRARGPGAEERIERDRQVLLETFGERAMDGAEGPLEHQIVDRLKKCGRTLVCTESLTGGNLGDRLTEIPGVSSVFLGDFVAYDNALKIRVLGVREATIARVGAVSEEVALEMAEGARRVADADWALATTGIAGPSGGSEEKPVGTAWVAVAGPEGFACAECRRHPGGRSEVKARVSHHALDLLRRSLT